MAIANAIAIWFHTPMNTNIPTHRDTDMQKATFSYRTYTTDELDRIAILTSRLEELLWQKYVEPTLREGKVVNFRSSRGN